MKQIILATVIAFTGSVFAAQDNRVDIKCIAERPHDFKGGSSIYLTLKGADLAAGTVDFYNLTIVNVSPNEFEHVPDFSAGSTNGKDLKAVKYNGRKYVGYKKFSFYNKGDAVAGAFRPDNASVIINPLYTVVKTIPQSNNWDKTWTWDVEVRKHLAVMPTNFDDHHGDYIPLDCYTWTHVNDSKRRP